MDSELMFNVPSVQVFVLTTNLGAEKLRPQINNRPWVKIINTGERSNLPRALKELYTEFKISRISVIGGRTLTTDLIDAGLVSDLYLTTSAISGGQKDTPFYVGSKNVQKKLILRKIGKEGPEDGVIFEHFTIRPK